ncbi:zinc finger (C3HC4-type RING finger) family protein [Actinidia rufa]|uniref:RING-type E3 ubiquitin transferase n=1 Tax=Actinidia rufa TaxID=165716 RepID=A0A7J0H7N7_9ERIC|nr:zinc finger (C3HC4-type RING finger) family protein [Actinidia rufa]
MVGEETKQSPPNPKNGKKIESMFSPRFKSVAEMAGWDEEALLIASLVVEDTPDRDFKQKKRSDLQFKTPPTNSRRKRRAQRKSPVSVSVPVLDFDEDETSGKESGKKKIELKTNADEKKGTREERIKWSGRTGVSSSSSCLPCMDKLRDELSCAICLEICFEPSTTSCGHSFCKKCLRSAADKCGKRCPKSMEDLALLIQFFGTQFNFCFHKKLEARKASVAHNSRETEHHSPPRRSHYNARNWSIQALNNPEGERQSVRRESHCEVRNRSVGPSGTISFSVGGDVSVRRRRRVPGQDEDAALALRLQREEFMEVFRGSDEQYRRSSLALARANLRAMATRAANTPYGAVPTLGISHFPPPPPPPPFLPSKPICFDYVVTAFVIVCSVVYKKPGVGAVSRWVLPSKYCRSSDFLESEACSGCSWGWRSIIWGKELMMKGLVWRVCNGQRINIFKHQWIPKSVNPHSERSGVEVRVDLKVSHLFDPLTKAWRLPLISMLFPAENVPRILSIYIPTSEMEDSRVRASTRNVEFSGKSAYSLLSLAFNKTLAGLLAVKILTECLECFDGLLIPSLCPRTAVRVAHNLARAALQAAL